MMCRSLWMPVQIMLVAVLCFVGCGKKGDPLPPERTIQPAAVELSARKTPDGNLLRWRMLEENNFVHRFRILRREIVMPGEGCEGSTDQTKLLLDLYADDPLLVREGKGSFRYLDETASPDGTYGYRIIACNVSGYCAEASPEAIPEGEIKIE
ncbi:MAG: hypothetical protein JW950_07710 [Deltaproteobacteria bacterium]|nr:hypothetical protein [Deltaproteobacteria bacterium]